ncbi:hypothetical protein V8F06_005141 [Rhypophila decipiens]
MTPTPAPHNAILTAWESHKSSLASGRKEHLAQFETITTGGGICQYGTVTLTEKDFPAAYKHIQDKREGDNRINKEQNKETNSLPELTRLRYTAEVVRPVAPNKEPVDGYPLYIGLHGGGGWESSNFSWDDKTSPDLVQSQVIADYKAWKDSWKNGKLPTNTPGTVAKPTNAILHWFTKSRSPVPQYIAWDLTTPRGNDNINEDICRCLGAKGSQNYWLDIGEGTRLTAGVPIVAGMDDKTNTVTIYSTGNMSYLRILLRPHMKVSIEKDITVQIYSDDNTTQPQIITPIQIGWSTNVINDTVARNDPSLVFCSDIVLTKDSNGAKTWYWNTNSPKTPAKKSRL